VKKPLLSPLSFAVIAALTAPSVVAKDSVDNDSIERIEVYGKLSHYSATKSDTPIVDVARSVSIEDQLQIIEKGALNLDDTYVYSAGVTGQTYGFATRGDWVKVRGLSVPQYQDSLQSLFGNYNNTRPEIYTLEQVEILKGPASVLYGKGSPGGIVNVVSKTPKVESAHEIVLELGNFNRKQFAVDSTGAIDDDSNWLYRFVSVYRDSETQVDFVEDNTIVVAPSITWMPSSETSATLLLNYTESEGDTGAQFLPIQGTLLSGPDGKKIDSSTYAGEPGFNLYKPKAFSATFMFEQVLSDDWAMSATARYTDASSDYKQAWTTFLGGGNRYVYNPDGSVYGDGMAPRSYYRNDGESEQKAVDIRLLGEIQTGDINHKILIGTQYQDVMTGSAGYYAWAPGLDFTTFLPDQVTGDLTWINLFNPEYGRVDIEPTLDAMYAKNATTNAKDLGIYISDQIDIGDFSITLGARYDDSESETSGQNQEDSELSLSAGLLYKFAEGLSGYINYAESFDPVIGDNGNGELLKPQFGEQVEVGFKYLPENIDGYYTLAWFDISQTNLPDPNSSINDYQQQSGEAKIDGIEFESVTNLGQFSLELNASKLSTESPDGFQLASIPEVQASSWLSYKATGDLEGFKTALGVRYTGDSYGGVDQIKTPSYTIADFMIGYQVEQWNFALNVRNLTDKSYYATCLARGDCFPGEARTVVGRVSYSF